MKKSILGLLVPSFLLMFWEFGSRSGFINQMFFPAPTEVLISGWDKIIDGSLFIDFGATLSTLLIGFGIGATAGYGLGLAMGISRFLRELLEPMLSVIYTIPKIVLFPIFMIIFGLGQAPKIALVSLTVFFYVWINTLSSVKNLPVEYLVICKSITNSRIALFKDVIIPASAPAVFTGLRIGIAVATLITISSEFVTGDTGLGYLIFNSRFLLRYDDAYLGIFAVGLLGFTLQTIVKQVGNKVTPWSKGLQNSNIDVKG